MKTSYVNYDDLIKDHGYVSAIKSNGLWHVIVKEVKPVVIKNPRYWVRLGDIISQHTLRISNPTSDSF